MRKLSLLLILGVTALNLGCGESVPDYERDYVNRLITNYNGSSDLWEKGQAAQRIATSHWSEKEKQKWIKKSEIHKADWRDSNCKAGAKSAVEIRLLNDLPSRKPLAGIDWSDAAYAYQQLFDLCGDQTYAEKHSKYKGLAEFYSKTRDICGEVVHTYSGSVVGAAIKRNYSTLSEMTNEVAQGLGEKAVEGYGECMCVMHNYFGVKDQISIGFCIDDTFHECKTAFCGATGDRKEIAKALNGYRYSAPRGSSYQSSYGAGYSDLLEWGKRQTEILVQDYCSTNPHC